MVNRSGFFSASVLGAKGRGLATKGCLSGDPGLEAAGREKKERRLEKKEEKRRVRRGPARFSGAAEGIKLGRAGEGERDRQTEIWGYCGSKNVLLLLLLLTIYWAIFLACLLPPNQNFCSVAKSPRAA